VPVLTLPGSHLFGRFTLGLYQEMQIADAIVSDVEQYADRAVRLAKDREYRQSVASLIAARSDVLFGAPGHGGRAGSVHRIRGREGFVSRP
jgi:predicted O-linked N-acetylglucosamine transferase (SPINDLY family)